MANFNFTNAAGASAAQSSTVVSVLALTAATATLTQGCLIDVSFGQNGAPATSDGPVTWQIARCTSVGTAAANPVPLPSQTGWRATGAVCGINFTTAGNSPTGFNTAASILYAIPINQRASYRWMPVPGSELYWPATNLNGLVISSSAVTSTYIGTVETSGTYTE